MSEGQEQNRTEEPTPFKLQRAREKGTIARGTDLGFFGALVGVLGFMLVAGDAMVQQLAEVMRRVLGSAISGASDPRQAASIVDQHLWTVFYPLILLGGTVLLVVVFLELVQLRGVVFSATPLKPDFGRLNPAKGLKRLFSLRMFKEALKNVLKFTAYTTVCVLLVRSLLYEPDASGADARALAASLRSETIRLIIYFGLVAMFFTALDQIIARREFLKQMRMSRREVTREAKDREGDPRIKRRRKQLHSVFAQQGQGMAKLPGSDLLVVNPEHFAVALGYDPAAMAAPTVRAKARNLYALAMKREAARLNIPIIENPPLARALYADVATGSEVGSSHYRDVADLYLSLRRMRAAALPKPEDKSNVSEE
jgi:flagellar biosynthetic protein FlhB